MSTPLLLGLILTASPLQSPFRELSLDEALELAAPEKRVVFVDFFTTWCEPCKQLDRVTWKDERVVAWLDEHTIAIKVDAEDEPALAGRFHVDAYPTLLFLEPDGRPRGRLVGYLAPNEFLAAAADALAGIPESQRIERQLADAPLDPSLRMKYGAALAREGDFERALEEYLWCFDEGLAHDPGFSGVRNSFLLSHIVALDRDYPPAGSALRTREVAARARLLAGAHQSSDPRDVASICRDLGELPRLLALWDELEARGRLTRELRGVLFEHVLDLLLEEERYAEVLEGSGDVFAFLDRKLSFFALATADLDDPSLHEYMLRTTLVDASKLYRALLGAGDMRAADYAERVLAFDSSGQAFAQLVRAAAATREWSNARELLRRGYETVESSEEGVLRAAERKLPKEERLAPAGE